MVGDVAEDEKPTPPPVNKPTVLALAPGHRGSTGSPAPGPPPPRGGANGARHSTGGSPAPTVGSPGSGVVVPPPPRKPGSTPPPPSSNLTPASSPAPSHRDESSVLSLSQITPVPGLDTQEPGLEGTPESAILTDDDLAHFPDELCEHARMHVKKRLLQALVDVRSLDSQVYNSLVWMLNNDITNVIDETFTVVSTSTGPTLSSLSSQTYTMAHHGTP